MRPFSSPWPPGVWSAWGAQSGRRARVRRLPAGGKGVQSPAATEAPGRAAARSQGSGRRPPASVPFSLSWCHMSGGGVGTRGVGGGAQSTYMRRGPADGCQEFPMKGDGGKFGQLGLANGEPREGSAPSPRPRPPRLPQRECVRLAHCAWRLGSRQAVRELQPPPPPAAAIASSAAAEPGAGEQARPR